MVLYYTFHQKTKIFAEVLGHVLNQPVYGLESDLNKKPIFLFILSALASCFTKKTYPVTNMPQAIPNEIFICSPVWGGDFAAPVRYFLQNADLQDVTVNVLLTASTPTEKYKKNVMETLIKTPCKPGEVYLFATSDKLSPEKDVIIEQLNQLLPGQ